MMETNCALFRLYRDSDVYTLGTRIGGLGQELRTLSLTLAGVLTELKCDNPGHGNT
jgi:hypothetical protein